MAFRNAAARLLAVAPISVIRGKRTSSQRVRHAAARRASAANGMAVVLWSRNCRYLLSWRRQPIMTLIAQSRGGAVRTFAHEPIAMRLVERACVVCEILTAHFLAE